MLLTLLVLISVLIDGLAANFGGPSNCGCQNGRCEKVGGSNICQCLPGYTGNLCQTTITQCNACLCQNGGTCINYSRNYKCKCQPGFYGNNCENAVTASGYSCASTFSRQKKRTKYCLVLQGSRTTGYRARNICQSLGYDLVVIETRDEQTFINSHSKDLLIRNGAPYWLGLDVNNQQDCRNHVYSWYNGAPVSYTNFYSSNPPPCRQQGSPCPYWCYRTNADSDDNTYDADDFGNARALWVWDDCSATYNILCEKHY